MDRFKKLAAMSYDLYAQITENPLNKEAYIEQEAQRLYRNSKLYNDVK